MSTKKAVKVFIAAIVSVFIIYICYKFYMSINKSGVFSSIDAFKNFISGKGILAPFVFFLIQVVQIIISPIPGNVTTLAGGVLFGPLESSLLSCGAIILGSAIAFYLARAFGKPLVSKFVNQNVIDKYDKMFSSKSQNVLLIFFLIPFFPDDALCFLSGLSNMPFKTFITLVILGRSPGTVFASLAGSGIIHMSAELWTIAIVISAVAIILYMKYSKAIENYILSKIKRKSGS